MILAKGEIVWLRRRTLEDVPIFFKWRQMNGQAKLFDAPWEKDQPEPDEEYIARITKSIEGEKEDKFGMAIIVENESTRPIGTVNCYADKGNQDHKYVGVAIYEDSLISKGLGTEALKLWIDYLFRSRNLHHIGIETWSFNKRMIRVAEKIGFKNEGCEREIREWNGEWLDKLHYGLNRNEWENGAQQNMKKNGKGNNTFDSIVKITNLYVAMLGIVGLLATVGIFPIRSKPQIKVLRPIYIFNMAKVSESIDSSKMRNYFRVEGKDKNVLAPYGKPEDMDTKKGMPYYLPYERLKNWKQQGWSGLSPWYIFGITDSSVLPKQTLNYSAYRTDEEKRLGLSMLYVSDVLEEAAKNKLDLGQSLVDNPLEQLYKLKGDKPGLIDNENLMKFVLATKVYSFITVSNKTSELMGNIRFFVNDVVYSGYLEVVGFTAASTVSEINPNSPNLCYTIERLEPGQSIEFLIKGYKTIRESEIKITMPFMAGIRKDIVIMMMVLIFVFVITLYLFPKYKNIRKVEQIRK